MRPNVFWGKYESDHAYPTSLGSEECDDVRGADGAELLADIRIVADRGGGRAPMLLHVEEDV